MSKSIDPKDLESLRKAYYALLKTTGFQDVEIVIDTQGNLVQNKLPTDSNFLRRRSPDQIEEKTTYFRLASQFVNSHKFSSPLELAIWTLHSNGFTIKQIAKTKRLTCYKVFITIKRLKAEMLHP